MLISHTSVLIYPWNYMLLSIFILVKRTKPLTKELLMSNLIHRFIFETPATTLLAIPASVVIGRLFGLCLALSFR
jgi:hypothetical protein